jgi:hypothetical protein
MKRNIIYKTIGVYLTICLLGFSSVAQIANNDLAQKLAGQWRNQYVKVIMHTCNNSDSTVTIEADTSNWEKILEIKPIRTYFKPDGTYYSEYRNLKDSIIRTPSGLWHVTGDSITMNQLKPYKNSYTLQVSINNNLATFKGLLDFDGDGKVDDEYYGIQKKF